MLDENIDESSCAAEAGKKALSEVCEQVVNPAPDCLLRWGRQGASVRHLMDIQDVCSSCENGLCSSLYIRPLLFLKKSNGREKKYGQSVVYLGKKIFPLRSDNYN